MANMLESNVRHLLLTALVCLTLAAGCATSSTDSAAPRSSAAATEGTQQTQTETLPELAPVNLGPAERLQVVATTNIVADVVLKVGGQQIDLKTLMPIGADPHGFEVTPRDIVELDGARVIFLNGLGLEEPLKPVLDSLDDDSIRISVNAGVETLHLGHEDPHDHDHDHDGVDPHTWFSVRAVEQWVSNIEQVLSALDPARAGAYRANAESYLAEIDALKSELAEMVAELPIEQRKLVTDHHSFGYFADEYGFEVIGTIVPSFSTLAAPSPAQLAALQDQIVAEGVKAVFVGASVNPAVAEQLAADTGIRVVSIRTGSLSDADDPASSYLDFMRYNTAAIVEALK